MVFQSPPTLNFKTMVYNPNSRQRIRVSFFSERREKDSLKQENREKERSYRRKLNVGWLYAK